RQLPMLLPALSILPETPLRESVPRNSCVSQGLPVPAHEVRHQFLSGIQVPDTAPDIVDRTPPRGHSHPESTLIFQSRRVPSCVDASCPSHLSDFPPGFSPGSASLPCGDHVLPSTTIVRHRVARRF